MPDVELVAIQDFSYSTRRLKAGDSFTVPEKMAKVLVGIKKAEFPREVGKVAPPPPALVAKVVIAAPVKVEEESVGAMSTASVDKPKRTVRRRARKSTAKK